MNMEKELKNLIQKNTLRDVEIKLKEAKIAGMIIPGVVFEIIHRVEDEYDGDTERKDEGELTPEEMQEKADELRNSIMEKNENNYPH